MRKFERSQLYEIREELGGLIRLYFLYIHTDCVIAFYYTMYYGVKEGLKGQIEFCDLLIF